MGTPFEPGVRGGFLTNGNDGPHFTNPG
jgi:hypothetical protein